MFHDGIRGKTFDYSKKHLYSIVNNVEYRKRISTVKGKTIVNNYQVLKVDRLEMRIDSYGRLHFAGSPISFIHGDNALSLSREEYIETFHIFFDTLGINPHKAILERSEFFVDFIPNKLTPSQFVNRCYFMKNVEFKNSRTRDPYSLFYVAEGQKRSFKAYVKKPNLFESAVRFEITAALSFYKQSSPSCNILFTNEFFNMASNNLIDYSKKILFAEPNITSLPKTKKDIILLTKNGRNKLFWTDKPSRMKNNKKRFMRLQLFHTTNEFGFAIAQIERQIKCSRNYGTT